MPDKVRTTISIDREVAEKAKEIGLNISKVCENCLKHAIKRMEGNNNPISPDSWVKPSSKEGSWCGCRDLNPGYQRGRLRS